MKQLITEETILQMKYNRVQGRPAVVLENFDQYTWSEQQQINEAYDAIYDLLQQEVIEEFSLSGAKANIKGKFAGAKAAIQGDTNAGDVGKQAELQSLFDDLKRNIGTIVAQHEKDVSKLGFGPDDQITKSLAQIRQTIESSPANIEIKDSSMTGKAGQFAADKVMPLVAKAISPISKKIEQLYDKSGPIKDFDTKYQQLITQITQQNPKLAEPVAKFSEMAKKHKGKATFIIGGLTAILTATGALAAGGVGAFVIGVGLRGIYGLLAGEPPAKAFGKAAITAAIGKLVGMGAKELFSDVSFGGGDETMAKAGVGEIAGGDGMTGAGGDTGNITDRILNGGSVNAGERWAANYATEISDGLSPDYVHDVMLSPELQPYFMNGPGSIDTNKFNGIISMLKNHPGREGHFMPEPEEFGEVLKQHLAGDAASDAGADAAGGYDVEADMSQAHSKLDVDGDGQLSDTEMPDLKSFGDAMDGPSDKVKDAFDAVGYSADDTDPAVLKFLDTGDNEMDLKNMINMGGSSIDPTVAAELTQRGYSSTQIYNAYLNAYGAKANLIPNAEIPSMANFAKDVLEKAGR